MRKKPQGREQAFRVSIEGGELSVSRQGKYYNETLFPSDKMLTFDANEQHYEDGSRKVTVTITNAENFDAYTWALRLARSL